MNTDRSTHDWGPLAEPFHADKQLPTGAPPWRENVFIGFFDRQRRIYGTAHFTGSLNAGGRRARASVVIDGRAAEIVEPMALGEFGTQGVQLDLGGHLSAKSPDLQLDLRLAPRHPEIDYSASKALPGLDDTEPLRHYQRSGTFTGSVGLRDEAALDITGLCFRDRTWGYREENQHWLEYYACFLCFETFDLSLMKFSIRDATAPVHGALSGSRSDHVTGANVKRNAWGSVTHLTAQLDTGTKLALTAGPPEARIFLPLGEPDGPYALTAYDEFVEVTAEDGTTGFGMIEQGVLRQLD